MAPRESGGVAHAIAAGDSVAVGKASFASAPTLTVRVNVTLIVTTLSGRSGSVPAGICKSARARVPR